MPNRLRSTWLLLAIGLISSLMLTGCHPITDGSTRLAGEIKEGASKLRDSNQDRLTIVHRPRSMPEGIDGAYEILLQSSVEYPTKGAALAIFGLDDHGTKIRGRAWSTSYHQNFVSVPKELRIRKAKGASTIIQLHKVGDAIEVEALR